MCTCLQDIPFDSFFQIEIWSKCITREVTVTETTRCGNSSVKGNGIRINFRLFERYGVGIAIGDVILWAPDILNFPFLCIKLMVAQGQL